MIPLLILFKISGRYTQCEMMCAHYKYPILLIEFEEDKAFTFDVSAPLMAVQRDAIDHPLLE